MYIYIPRHIRISIYDPLKNIRMHILESWLPGSPEADAMISFGKSWCHASVGTTTNTVIYRCGKARVDMILCVYIYHIKQIHGNISHKMSPCSDTTSPLPSLSPLPLQIARSAGASSAPQDQLPPIHVDTALWNGWWGLHHPKLIADTNIYHMEWAPKCMNLPLNHGFVLGY